MHLKLYVLNTAWRKSLSGKVDNGAGIRFIVETVHFPKLHGGMHDYETR